MMSVILAEWRQFFQPLVNVLNQPGFIVIYVNSRGDVHRRNQHHSFLHTTFFDDTFHPRSQVNILAMLLGVKCQVFRMKVHGMASLFSEYVVWDQSRVASQKRTLDADTETPGT